MDTLGTAAVDPLAMALRFAAALGLGVLLGLERERAKKERSFAGERTFGLLALAGGIAAFLDSSLDRPWLALGVFAAVAGLVVVSTGSPRSRASSASRPRSPRSSRSCSASCAWAATS